MMGLVRRCAESQPRREQGRSASFREYRLRCYGMTAELFRDVALGTRDYQVVRVRRNANPGKTFTRRSEAAAKVTFVTKPLLCARFFAFALVAQLDRASDFEAATRFLRRH